MESNKESEATPSKTNVERKIFIPWTDDEDLLYANYFYGEKTLPHRQKLNKPSKPLANAELSYRVINYWEKSGLIDVDRGEGGTGWRKYSAMDAIWIHLIAELRRFGVSIENIKKIKEQLTAHNEKFNPSIYPLLEFYTSLFMMRKEKTYILISDDFVVEIATQSQIDITNMMLGEMCNHISISLHNIIKTVYQKHDLKLKEDSHIGLSKEEEILLGEIRSGAYNSIEVQLKNGKIFQLNKEIIHSDAQIYKLLQGKNYCDITFKTENGKVVHAQQIIKQRL